MSHLIWTCDYEINSFLVNPLKRLGSFALLNLLQDTAWSHATHLGFGFKNLQESRVFWVLTRQKLKMNHWPQWGDRIQIKTWVREPSGPFAIRDFEICQNHKKIGESTTSWLLLDAETRKPLKNAVKNLDFEPRKEGVLDFDVPKIELKKDLQPLSQFQVRNSDLDMHQHVNNTRYLQWILDSIPFSLHSKLILHEYEVNFLNETKDGDIITIQRDDTFQKEAPNMFWAHFQGYRASDQKYVFSARVLVRQLQIENEIGQTFY
ncbi:MAG: acyl-[acyl-carrier-protein] thioesterase [Pseudobdellovibrionaceae bacterium]